MKFSKYLTVGLTAVLIGGWTATATVSANTTTYQYKVNTVHYYSQLPNAKGKFKHVKKTVKYDLKGVHVKVHKVKTVHHVKYAKVGSKWVQFDQLTKVKAKAKAKQHSATPTGNNDATSNSNDDSNTDNASSSSSSDTSNHNLTSPLSASSNNNSSTINWNDTNNTQLAVQAALTYLNQVRTQAGLPAFQLNQKLAQVANLRASQLVSNFSHYDSNGNLAFETTAKQLGYSGNQSPFGTWGENIYQGYVGDTDTPQTAGQQGIKSFQSEGPENNDGNEHGHYENDMSTSFNQVGIGFKYDPASQNTYLAVDFGVGNNNNTSSSTTPASANYSTPNANNNGTQSSVTTPTPNTTTTQPSDDNGGVKISHTITATDGNGNSTTINGNTFTVDANGNPVSVGSNQSTSNADNSANSTQSANNSNNNQLNNMNNYSPFANNQGTSSDNQTATNAQEASNDNQTSSNEQDPSSTINWTSDSTRQAAAQAAFNELNQARSKAGLPALQWDPKLAKVAEMRSNDLIADFNHRDSSGTIYAQKDAEQLGYSWSDDPFGTWGENIAQGNPADTIQAAGAQGIDMFQSEGPDNGDGQEHGHYENDMSTEFNAVGIGFSYDPNSGNTYLAVDFGYNG
ncbi:CAP domain-containing protein [Nicoliella spurrieriana]|uniref:CAP domain-containing protein n=1 Tax=Nicoliella spurrieriana TaxID=2925830 RepID=A0A976X5V1_9LACO|nr:CAP domain-containing protein [Nicoliella spurrieriana]UQS87330.1 CAP domain-containing protein [Nicoliella spurrieriana]